MVGCFLLGKDEERAEMIIKIGNILESNAGTLVNTVNCDGVMGKGIALDFKKKYPEMFKDYAARCAQKEVRPGVPYLYSELFGPSILNFPTKDHWRSPSKITYIEAGLDWFVSNYKDLGITYVAFPPLGCGNGGLSWRMVGPLMVRNLKDLPISIEIYAPYGTSKEELSMTFLESFSMTEIPNTRLSRVNPNWRLILYVVQQINQRTYACRVGRTTFQKICYVLTREGIETGFVFRKGKYGPYAPEVEQAERVMFNANLLAEKPLGEHMIEIVTSPDFIFDKSTSSRDVLETMEKTVDLFCRLKNTEQVEMTATILFSFDELLKDEVPPEEITLFHYVLEWKNRWANKDKERQLSEMIRSLALLSWIYPKRSIPLPDIEEIMKIPATRRWTGYRKNSISSGITITRFR